MIKLKYKDPPVTPAVEGRHELPNRGMWYTIGREYVAETAVALLRRNRTLALDLETFGLGNNRFRIKTVTFADDKDAVILDPRDPYQADIVRKMANDLNGLIVHNCLRGNTPVITRSGSFPIEELANSVQEIWDGESWTKAPIRNYGSARVRPITLAPNDVRSNITHTIWATENHRWKISRRTNGNKINKFITSEIKIGDVVPLSLPPIEAQEDSDAFRHGLIFADGWTIKEIGELTDTEEPVYCAEVPTTTLFTLGHGIVTGNSMYDAPSLYQRGLITKEDINKVIDTIVVSRQANPGENTRHNLEVLTKKHFNINIEKKIGSDEFYAIDVHMVSFIHGAAYDALYTFRLLPKLMREVRERYDIEPITKGLTLSDEEKKYIINREHHINHILLQRMKEGLCVDLDEVDSYESKIRPHENRFELTCKSYGMTVQPKTGTYTNRNQLISVLERDNAFPPGYKKTKGGAYSTAEDDLQHVRHPLAEAFAGLAKIMKIKQYLNTIADEGYDTGRVFPTTNILGAGTGRISMSNPPLQQFSPDARSVIVADPGDEFSSIDWSQIEPTILVYCADDTLALNQYENGKADFYEIVGGIVGIERKQAKTSLLAQMYGQGIKSMAMRLGVSPDQAREFKNRIFAAMPGVADFIEGMRAVGDSGKVHTLFGRVLDVPMWDGNFKNYTAVNYFIQGSAYDLLAESLMRIDEAGLTDGVYFTFHDEIVLSTAVAEEAARIMCTPPERFVRLLDRVPLLNAEPIVLGRHWGKA